MIGSARKSNALSENNLKCLLSVALVSLILLAGCATEKRISRKLKKVFSTSATLKQYYAGFALYDMTAQKMLFEQHADQYFTPA